MFFTNGGLNSASTFSKMDSIIRGLMAEEQKLWNFLNGGDKNSMFIGLKGMHKVVLSLSWELEEIDKIQHMFLNISKNDFALKLEEELKIIRELLGNQIKLLVKYHDLSDSQIMDILNGNKIDPHISEMSTRLQDLCKRFLSDEEEHKQAA